MTHRLKSNQVLFLSDVRDTLGGNLKVMYDYLDSDYYKKITLYTSLANIVIVSGVLFFLNKPRKTIKK